MSTIVFADATPRQDLGVEGDMEDSESIWGDTQQAWTSGGDSEESGYVTQCHFRGVRSINDLLCEGQTSTDAFTTTSRPHDINLN